MKIHQTACFLSNLVKDVQSGALLPASFQRPYVWTQADVLALFESILNGYPVGGFLLWSPWKKADLSQVARRRLGPVLAQEQRSDPSLLLDGQNRLATMAWLTHDGSTPLPHDLSQAEQAVWGSGQRLVFDLESGALAFVPAAEEALGLRVPARLLIDGRGANTVLRQRWDTAWSGYTEAQRNDGLRRLDLAQNAFRDARVTVTDMQDATAEEAKHAFLHICRVGVPMSAEDFDRAIRWAVAT